MRTTDNGKSLLAILAIATLVTGLVAIISKSTVMIFPTIILGLIAVTGAFSISNDPPSVAVITRLGKRTTTVFKEGLAFLFLRGIIYNYILIDVLKKNIDFAEQVLTTPNDNATTKVEASLSYAPDKENILNYLNNGREEGIAHMIEDIVEEKLRIWSRSTTEGPKTWQELNGASDELITVILKEICKAEKDDDDEDDDTEIDLPEKEIRKIRRGNGHWPIPHLGIILIRFNLTKMESFGKVYEASVNLQKEEKERASETYEVQSDLEKAKALKDELSKSGVNVSLDDAMKQIMEWKIKREANSQMSISSIAAAIVGSFTGGK